MILNALEGKPLPVYGEGKQVRDWLYVEDHAYALYKVVTGGSVGETSGSLLHLLTILRFFLRLKTDGWKFRPSQTLRPSKPIV